LVGAINVSIWCIFLAIPPLASERQILLGFAAIHTICVVICAASRNSIWAKTYLRVQIALTVMGLALLFEFGQAMTGRHG